MRILLPKLKCIRACARPIDDHLKGQGRPSLSLSVTYAHRYAGGIKGYQLGAMGRRIQSFAGDDLRLSGDNRTTQSAEFSYPKVPDVVISTTALPKGMCGLSAQR